MVGYAQDRAGTLTYFVRKFQFRAIELNSFRQPTALPELRKLTATESVLFNLSAFSQVLKGFG